MFIAKALHLFGYLVATYKEFLGTRLRVLYLVQSTLQYGSIIWNAHVMIIIEPNSNDFKIHLYVRQLQWNRRQNHFWYKVYILKMWFAEGNLKFYGCYSIDCLEILYSIPFKRSKCHIKINLHVLYVSTYKYDYCLFVSTN